MRHVIAGAAGFIGSHLRERLIEEGHEVVALDNLITGSIDNIGHLLANPAFQFVKQDVCQPLSIPGTVMFHLASLASPVEYLKYPIETLDSGSIGTRNMLELAREHGARFLLTSTSECYGDPLEHPQRETYWGNVNPVGMRSCYDESKRFAEALTIAYHRQHSVRTAIARIFNTYGPRRALHDGRVVPAFIDQALRGENLSVFGDGSQTRSSCYVSDLVKGLVRLMEADEVMPVNLGNPHEMTILEFANLIRARVGAGIGLSFHPLPSDDPRVRRPDVEKAKCVLGWEPRVSLEEGLATTIDFFRTRMNSAQPPAFLRSVGFKSLPDQISIRP